MARARPASDLPRTLAEFDAWHARQPERWEFLHGSAVMMAPASNAHSLIKTNLGRLLGNALRGTACRAFVDGPQVRTADVSAIPDVVVACGEIDMRQGIVDEPKLIVEVSSRSTERDDTGVKWRAYCLMPSLQHYLVVDQERRLVQLHTRVEPYSWREEVVQDGGIEVLGVTLPLAEIYEGVVLAPRSDA
ncbi:MAG: Uma2 family endonuclease [Geminicoccaceae bacterium]